MQNIRQVWKLNFCSVFNIRISSNETLFRDRWCTITSSLHSSVSLPISTLWSWYYLLGCYHGWLKIRRRCQETLRSVRVVQSNSDRPLATHWPSDPSRDALHAACTHQGAALCGTVWNCVALWGTVGNCVTLCGTMWHCGALWGTVGCLNVAWATRWGSTVMSGGHGSWWHCAL